MLSCSNEPTKSNFDAKADHCRPYTGLGLVPAVDILNSYSPATLETPVRCHGNPENEIISLVNSIYLQLNSIWSNILARLRVLLEFLVFWPRVLLFEIPRLVIPSAILVITVSWLSLTIIFNTSLQLLTTSTAWTLLALYLCAFSLQTTWITLRNVAVARRGQLTIREVFDSISGNRALAQQPVTRS